ncbi:MULTISPECIES: tetratricopeptide repeat protein [Ramlibacter]|uniref:Ancillary SecYEG translocon subunit n=1 Tax=Ramlibacter aquaticus TaxID=2780094 RepID=A0ABR9SET6_9BURK|nr:MULTISPECIES: tetratricopeptide repeat protein [Ramlibacter]MBE7940247.1 tetratricopeptide repeat protein [Ramlibacter aquaticus]
MANNLDLEEQEQLDQLKHFWNEYGNLITWVAIIVFGSIAAWNGWQYWQRNQAAQASALYDEVERYAQAGDTARLERAFGDMKDRFGRTAWAGQAGLETAQALAAKGNLDGARTALEWVAGSARDEGYQAVARLRLAAVLVERKAYDDALKQLTGGFPQAFEALAADRRGDVYNLQGKKAEAKAEYEKAFKGFSERDEYRRLVDVKLTALGVDTRTLAAPAAPAASEAAKQP